MIRRQPWRIVEVEWRDSASFHGWGTTGYYDERGSDPSVCRTVGYLLKKDANEVFLVMSRSDNNNVNDSMTIPRECVLRIRYLKGGDG